MTIDSAARAAGVSPATIRNWIKTGYLMKDGEGLILEDSLRQFLNTVAGREKLNSRANKSLSDMHDHDQLQETILGGLTNGKLSCDSAGTEYEESLSDSYRNREGIYYTPTDIVADMLSHAPDNVATLTFCDPCCGSGNFIMRALELGFKPGNVYGFDVDPVAVEITRRRIREKSGYVSSNIMQADFLECARNKSFKFDYIYTNPPWGRKIAKKKKDGYAVVFNAGKSTDACALFFFAALSCLNSGGSTGFLLPEAFFTVGSFEGARKKALEYGIMKMTDYGKPFNGLMTKALGLILSSGRQDSSGIICVSGSRSFLRSPGSFQSMPKSVFSLRCDENDARVIRHVYSREHVLLAGFAEWGLGIVTGNNRRFILDTPHDGYMPVYRGADITRNGLKEPSAFIPRDLSLYQQVASVRLYEAPEKLIYCFISSRLKFFHDTRQRYMLNSANMLVPSKNFPLGCAQLADLFNSAFMNWMFSKIFNTCKVLRGDLEVLPVHLQYFDVYPDFDEKRYLDFLGIEAVPDGSYNTG